jgi:hypothetical protein
MAVKRHHLLFKRTLFDLDILGKKKKEPCFYQKITLKLELFVTPSTSLLVSNDWNKD